MVRWSGAGRICWTSSPAGIRGKRRLGKDDFRRGATFLLCAHPAPERRPRGTQTAGEPKLVNRQEAVTLDVEQPQRRAIGQREITTAWHGGHPERQRTQQECSHLRG